MNNKNPRKTRLTSLELCAGAGGQAIGLEMAGFEHVGLVEIDVDCCATLRINRPKWNVIQKDLRFFVEDDGLRFKGVDLLAGGLPCPPFSVAGKQLGAADERNMFPPTLDLIEQIEPKAIMIENVRGFLDDVFKDYRTWLVNKLDRLGYTVKIQLLNASDFGVPQLRPRVAIVGLRKDINAEFSFPTPRKLQTKTVGETLRSLMASRGWKGADAWAEGARDIAPTLVGGSKKHGGPDLGPTRAKRAWASLGVDGMGIANEAPGPDFKGLPKLTVEMTAKIQGFPDEWRFYGGKTAAYRQVGNAFPPPVAAAVANRIAHILSSFDQAQEEMLFAEAV